MKAQRRIDNHSISLRRVSTCSINSFSLSLFLGLIGLFWMKICARSGWIFNYCYSCGIFGVFVDPFVRLHDMEHLLLLLLLLILSSVLFFCDINVQPKTVLETVQVTREFGFPFFAIFASRLSSVPFTRSLYVRLTFRLTFRSTEYRKIVLRGAIFLDFSPSGIIRWWRRIYLK